MADVADLAGVSRSTVSFALNNASEVSEATRQRVRKSAAQLGYRRNAGARSLAARTSDLYGLVTDIVTTPFAGELISGAQDAVWQKRKILIISATSAPDDPDPRGTEAMVEHRVGGVVVATTTHRPIAIPAALHRAFPVVLVHCFDDATGLPSVVPDEVGGGRQAAELLLARGRRRIGMINLAPGLPATSLRRRGFEKALKTAGCPPQPEWIAEVGADSVDGYVAARTLLSSHGLDGLFCANDRLAMGAYDAARELRLTIPHDISIVGFDNQEIIAGYLRPALTTISLPFREMGRIGAELVMGNQDDLPERTVVPCPPVLRQSV